jgi:hypothetical protein
MAFEGNFINLFANDGAGHEHMVQAKNDPNIAPPARGSKLNMVFAAQNAIILNDAALASRK